MAWEQRGNSKYYYRKKRVGKRVISEYLGNGPLAEYAALHDQLQASEREEAREEGRQPEEENPELDSLLKLLAGNMETITRAYLLASGYHQHKGQWRKSRDATTS